MEKCSEVNCGKPMMQNSQLGCCEEHEMLLRESLNEEYQLAQKELYNDYVDDVNLSINNALSVNR